MKKELSLFLSIALISTALVGCTSNMTYEQQQSTSQKDTTSNETSTEPTSETSETVPDETQTETIPEETQAETYKFIEYTNDETNIPKELIETVHNCYEAEFGSYLYGDIDRDNAKELLAAYLDYSAGQWKIVKLENGSSQAEDFYSISLYGAYEKCDMDLLDFKTEIHLAINLNSEWGTDYDSHILAIDQSEVTEKLSLFASVYQDEYGNIIIQRTSCNNCIDTTTGMMMGRTWSYSYLNYDTESGQYQEYAAYEITEEEFLEYEGALEIEQSIKDKYDDKELKLSFYRRNNGIMYVQYEYMENSIITYEYYTLFYEDQKILNQPDLSSGIIDKGSTNLDIL